MKTVMAIIRIDKMNRTKRMLSAAGISSMTALSHVHGRGNGLVDRKIVEGATQNIPEAVAQLGTEPRLRPQRVVYVTVPNDKVETVVNTIIEANQTGQPGDGKIFVLPENDAIRVRSGEYGDHVLD
ncbi:MAG: P-II family nitrogen regulator [Bacteroidales bacterium]|jgi:nitrogen regulatory protein PII 2|nr:P-II family nitrogen regulator [Bacteroidales bacterium]